MCGGGMKLMTRRQFRVYFVLVVCLTVIFYATLTAIFRSDDPVTVYNVQRYKVEQNDKAATQLTLLGGHIQELCRRREVRRFLRSAPHVRQSRVFYNNTGVCVCDVPKAASTSLGRLMLMAEFPELAVHYSHVPGNNIHTIKADKFFKSETCSDKSGLSFLVARDPYARLFSAYVDKVFLQKFGIVSVVIDAILNNKLPKDTLINTATINDIATSRYWMCSISNTTFEQFLAYVAKTRHLDPHYTPVSLKCDLCKDPVDFVFKQENLKEDSRPLIEYLNKSVNMNRLKPVALSLHDYVGDSGVDNLVRTHFVAWKHRLNTYNCTLDKQSHQALYRRLWDAMKMLGNIDDNMEFIPQLFENKHYDLRLPGEILSEFRANNISVLMPAQREQQRHKYLVNAFKSVNSSVLRDIQHLFQLDFMFFNYDIHPPS